MKFDVQKNGSSIILKVKERRLDSIIAADLKAEFLLLCRPKVTSLVIDLAAVEFCDSSGLSALLLAERQMKDHGGTVKLAHVHKKVMSLLKIAAVDRAFVIEGEGTGTAKR